ncbi:Hypothetical predicted protein [Olea europaea subsp. europaea]|uniref:Uncharacterized protein n=1 Tax=Olea europaea subsp. europaea TaxID=158383 RepID=A0A8S0TCZ7_OLEEU|nr:Hypothetical predicted protein [Olea europaea subsp. europaea]
MTSLSNKELALSLVELIMICFYLMVTTTQLGMQKRIGDVLDSVCDWRGALNAFKKGCSKSENVRRNEENDRTLDDEINEFKVGFFS